MEENKKPNVAHEQFNSMIFEKDLALQPMHLDDITIRDFAIISSFSPSFPYKQEDQNLNAFCSFDSEMNEINKLICTTGIDTL